MRADFAAVTELAEQLALVPTEQTSLANAAGRICRADILADRDSPAANVSAMDGYALRSSEVVRGVELPVAAQSTPGFPAPSDHPPHSAIQIFTGAVVPASCDAVVKREDVEELKQAQPADTALPVTSIRLGEVKINPGDNIRYQGENAPQGTVIVPAGSRLHAGQIAAAANFGSSTLTIAQRVRVRILVTGNELRGVSDQVQPWELRDSNGATLSALLGQQPWITVVDSQRAADDLDSLTAAITQSLDDCDALLLTGGVSMGDFDFVPTAVKRAGGTPVFHKLPIRPGKPIFGAVSNQGQLILGLPGNPVSVAVGARRFAIPLLRKMAGCAPWEPSIAHVVLTEPPKRTLGLHWFPLVSINDQGEAEWLASQGSGDLVALARSDGFIGLPPGATSVGPWPYWPW